MEMSNVYDGLSKSLFVSGTIEDYKELQTNDITTVVNLKSEEHDTITVLTQMGIAYYYIPVADWGSPRSEQIYTLLKIWDNTKGNMLLHCAEGRGRSASMAIAIIMHDNDVSFDKAKEQVETKRPCVAMLPEQMRKIRREME
jgi:protein-tyrosine phosphatase